MERVGIGIIGAGHAAELHAHALGGIRGSKCEEVIYAAYVSAQEGRRVGLKR